MSDTEQNRSEQATPHKLMRARDRGTVARGMDLGHFTVLATIAVYAWLRGPSLAAQIQLSARHALVAAPTILSSPNTVLSVTGSVLLSLAQPLTFLVATLFVVVLVVEIIQTGVVFSTEPLKLDLGRLSPAKGFKRVFSVRMLVETAKNVVKLAVYGALAFMVIRDVHARAASAITDAGGLADTLWRAALRLVGFFVAAAAGFAIIDQLIARGDFRSKMRMSRREVRREARDREGEPRMKQRRRRLHREYAKLSQSLRNIRGADVLITNPVHLAVALRYDPNTMAAPKVVSLGSHAFALRLKKLAFVYGLVIVENRPLARALYYSCNLDQDIPEQLYRQIADIYLAMNEQKSPEGRVSHDA